LERGLIENAGRAEVVGRPMTYTTTTLFLEYFGLRNLDELPAADELRRIPVQRPETLVTAEGPSSEAATVEGAASTVPSEQPALVAADTDTASSAQGGRTETAASPNSESELPR